MPGTLPAAQMYDHELNPIKGWWFPHAVDKTATVFTGETILAGSVAHQNSAAQWVAGLPDNHVGHFMLQNSYDFDTNGTIGNTQKNVMTGLPATAPFELYTTEYDTSYTYAPNDHLTAWGKHLTGYTAAVLGKVRPAAPYYETLVGVVTTGVITNEYRKSALQLYTYYLPVNLTPASSLLP